jgi:polar amino acid transport system substrate-binding protein
MKGIANAIRVVAILSGILTGHADAEGLPAKIEIVTEELPPYHFTEAGKITGLSTEIVQAVLDRLGVKGHFSVQPFSRAMYTAQHGRNVLIYSIVRTAAREHRFKWVGEVAHGQNFFYCLAGRDIKLGSLENAKRYRVGTEIGDFREDFLLQNGFVAGRNLESATNNWMNYAKLKSGRVDLWVTDKFAMAYTVRAAGGDPASAVRQVLAIDDPSVSLSADMAFGLPSDDTVVDAFREALANIKADGTYAAIIRKWSPGQ